MEQHGSPITVGVDWAHEAHRFCVLDHEGTVIGERDVLHRAAELSEACDWILRLSGGDPGAVNIAIEMPHGIVVDTLLERGFRVHSINPKQLDRFRDRFCVSGAKDDSRDARVLGDSMRTDPRAFRLIQPDHPTVISLREWSRMHDELQAERTKLANRFREQLRRYYPQFVNLTNDVVAPWALLLWKLIPTPEAARSARESRIKMLLRECRIRKHTAKDVLQALRQEPMVVAPGTAEAATAHLELLHERVTVVNSQLKSCEKKLRSLIAQLEVEESEDTGRGGEQHDATIALSMPGVGTIVIATLFAEASRPLAQRDYQALRALSGAAPVTKRSGRSLRVIRRQACNPRLRNAIYHWARVASQRDPAMKQKYRALRARGHSHGRALRTIADRLLGVLCAMLRSGTRYDASRCQAA